MSIEQTISGKADGMFRWAYCQLQELKKLKSTKPKYITEVLRTLPKTLDETYERILHDIEEMYREEAATLLRWLAYARSPPSLAELSEAAIINLAADDVEVDQRGEPEGTLDILSGLVTVQRVNADGDDQNSASSEDCRSESSDFEEKSTRSSTYGSESSNHEENDSLSSRYSRRLRKETTVRLAHFSVKEYLESKRILESGMKEFYLNKANDHGLLAESCLVYLMHYCRSSEKVSAVSDLVTFPLLRYAAESWFRHAALQQEAEVTRAARLLTRPGIPQHLHYFLVSFG